MNKKFSREFYPNQKLKALGILKHVVNNSCEKNQQLFRILIALECAHKGYVYANINNNVTDSNRDEKQ